MFELAWLLDFIYGRYGLLGLFFVALVGNATIFLPAPIDLLVFAVGALVDNPVFLLAVVFVTALGAALGEMSAYILGLLGVKTLQKMSEKRVEKIFEIGENLANKGIIIIFFGSFTPFPFDLIGIAAGLVRYDYKKFFVAAFAGKLARYLVIAFAGFLGATWVKGFFLI
ncbi:MAG: hypothetical protein CL943_02970 [Candidatus Diapherotrites archaeon]|uniref:VTT domain-containing protein n=1 Tax=Candidatus Iainarchaeum sp. TaxID=3101447 RepID=A0A2D6M1E4_9ARCH|nr:hypothetical protein [Candidatus Diapherotrites archaeon]|tara:strand:- start:286 stop:792 length:507 start_codon:yes stop_codon:yes gene_type:complete